MATGHRYVDAVRLLGGTDPVIKNLDTLLSTATLGMWDLIDAKSDLIRVGNDLLGRWRDWRAGHDWRSRTERIEAAHTILVTHAFLEALEALNLPFGSEDLEPSARWVSESPNLVLPAPGLPFEATREQIGCLYTTLSNDLARSLKKLAAWENLSEKDRDRVSAALNGALAKQAIARYEDRYRSLAIDVPEFAIWAQMIDHQATRAGLAELERLLLLTNSSRALHVQLDTLARVQRAVLQRPIAEAGQVPIGMQLPSLDEAYLSPRFRVAELQTHASPSQESWWSAFQVRDDLPNFLATHLTTSAISRAPLIVLGQPGAGKSVLTKVLSARLSSGFLPIRVPLRDVAANGSVQEQIEQAIYNLTGERLEWPALARAADGALPVVMLDGFDELLQATGVRQTDYLIKVAQFQQRERDAGRAVAVIVTSRTAVADRAEFPQGTLIARLEPFSTDQIQQWIDLWNGTNMPFLRATRLKPFAVEMALERQELAEQPLLLLMMALYDADGNALRKIGRDLGKAELYERLLHRFAERELAKDLPTDQVSARVDNELLRLSFVAFSMFNRGRQWATSEEVSADLVALLPQKRREETFASPLTPADVVLGRFFFIHEAQATRDAEVLRTYEFLHATFGEFLIARLIVRLVRTIIAQESAGMGVPFQSPTDDTLYALLSYALLSTRTPLITFLAEIVDALDQSEKKQWVTLMLRFFQALRTGERSPHAAYRPTEINSTVRLANYSANLMILALVAATQIPASVVFPDEDDSVAAWTRYAMLWRSQCRSEDWYSLLETVEVVPTRTADMKRDLMLQFGIDVFVGPNLDRIMWMFNIDENSSDGYVQHGSAWPDLVSRAIIFTGQADEAVMAHSLLPMSQRGLSWMVTSQWRMQHENIFYTPARLVMDILALPSGNATADVTKQRLVTYQRVLNCMNRYGASKGDDVFVKAILGDLLQLPQDYIVRFLEDLARTSPHGRELIEEIANMLDVADEIIWP